MSHQLPDIDPEETAEWIDSFDAVVDAQGRTRARFLLMKLLERARTKQVDFPATVSTPYVNTIPRDQEPWFPGDEYVERRIRAYIRWNAAAMVSRANYRSEGIGGHLATYASSASLYEVGFNHFFRGKSDGGFGDLVYFQGHASPGIYARAYVEGRLTEDQLDHFRQEVSGQGPARATPTPACSPTSGSTPPCRWASAPLCAIYQAHASRYLLQREIVDTSASRIWAFLGDGELDEVESIGALGVAGREHLDNLIFVVNCNLQRLDGPVRGNGKIIQEAEATFRGAGWNVIKVIWGSKWDELLARDIDGVLLDKMNTTPDGEFQKYATESGAYIREHFFGPDPRLRRLVEHLSDAELQALPRGGHDYRKLYAAYKLATEQVGQPTVILAKTVKGWTLGPEIEARNATHQIKKMSKAQLLALRDRLYLQEEIPDEALDAEQPPYYRPPEGSPAHEYLDGPSQGPGGPVAHRAWCVPSRPTACPTHKAFADMFAGSGTQAASTTMAFARLLRNLVRDPEPGAVRGSHRPRRGPHLRARAAHRRVQDLRARGPALHARRLRPHPALRRGPQGPGPAGGHHRGRGHGDRSSPWPRPTPRGADPCCRSTSSIRCSGSSASATSPGCSATSGAAASWPAAPQAAPPCKARASSTTTATRRCSPR